MVELEQGLQYLNNNNGPEWLRQLLQVIKDNPYLIAGLGMVMSGGIFTTIVLLIKNYYSKVVELITSWFIVRVRFTEISAMYIPFLHWFEENVINNSSVTRRNFTIRQISYLKEIGDIHFGPGEGNHFFIYKRRLFRLKLQIVEAKAPTSAHALTITDNEKNIFTLTMYGFNNAIMKDFIKFISNKYKLFIKDNNLINVVSVESSNNYFMLKHKKFMSTIFGNEEIKKDIISTVEFFINNKQWYLERGIPYKLGMILHGMPGTGKTSLIMALASYFDKSIEFLNSFEYRDINKNSIWVIEDIDCQDFVDINRDNLIETSSKQRKKSLSQLLNLLDGGLTPDGVIFVCTTNNIHKLDDAILRPGRIDRIYEIKPLIGQNIKDMCASFVPEFDNSFIKETDIITPNILQELLMKKIQLNNIDLKQEILNNLIKK